MGQNIPRNNTKSMLNCKIFVYLCTGVYLFILVTCFKVACDKGRKSLRIITRDVMRRGDGRLDLPAVGSEKNEFS